MGRSWFCACLRQRPKTDDETWRRIVVHTHYRLVLREVGYPLSEVTGSRELFEAVGDVLDGKVSAALAIVSGAC